MMVGCLTGQTSETPRDYHCNLGPDGRRRDADSRPELARGTVEFVAPKEYQVCNLPPLLKIDCKRIVMVIIIDYFVFQLLGLLVGCFAMTIELVSLFCRCGLQCHKSFSFLWMYP